MSKRVRTRWRAVLDATLGERGVPTQCALARDLQETYPTLRRVKVTNKTITFTDSVVDERLSWNMPVSAALWIQRFDESDLPDPDPEALILLKSEATIKGPGRKINPPGKDKRRSRSHGRTGKVTRHWRDAG